MAKTIVSSFILVSVFFTKPSWSQDASNVAVAIDSAHALQLVNVKTHKFVPLDVGQEIGFQARPSKIFEVGTIVEVNDSSISMVSKKTGRVSVRYQDLVAVKLQRTKDSRTAGTVLVVIGSLGTLMGIVALSSSHPEDASGVSEGLTTVGLVTGMIALPMLIAGTSLVSDKKYDLIKQWKVNVNQAPRLAEPTMAKETPAKETTTQADHRLRLKAGLGYGTTFNTGAFLLTFEPSYQASRDVLLGLRVEGVLPNGGENNFKGISVTLNFRHYLSHGDFKPYLGLGMGMYAFGNAKFGFYPALGFDTGHFFMCLEYNVISTTQPPQFMNPIGSYAPTPYIAEEISKYLGFRMGFLFGGSKK